MRTNPVNLRLTDADLEAIGEEEGWVSYAYDDADRKAVKTFITEENAHTVKGTLTIGYGHTRTVKPGMRIDRGQGLSLLRSDVRDAESCVHRYVNVPLTPGEFVGLVDLFYNVGPGSLPSQKYPNGKDGIACLGKSGGGRPSTLLTLLNKCQPHDDNAYLAVAGCFTQWVMPGSIFEWGLTKRRIRSMLRFMGLPVKRAELSFPNAPVPSTMRYDFVQRCIALAKEEAADQAAMRPAPKPEPTVTVIVDVPNTPASPVAPADKGGGAPLATQPADAPPAPTKPKPDPAEPGVMSGPTQGSAGPAGKAAPSPPVAIPKVAEKPKEPVRVPDPPPVGEPPPSLGQQREAVDAASRPGVDASSAKSMLLSRRFWGLLMIITGRAVFAVSGTDTLLKLGSDPIVSEMVANVMVMLAASAWEYCGEMLHTWGKARAHRPLK